MITYELLNDETHDAGKATTLVHEVGATTVTGTKTYEVVGMVSTCQLGTDKTTDDETDHGTFDN